MKPEVRKLREEAEYYTDERCFINELSNIPEDASVSIARARVMVDECTHWHRLRGITERYVILSGSGRVEVGDLEPTDVGPGDVVLIPPGVAQRIRNTGHADLVFLAICSPRFEQQYYEDLEPPL